MLTLAPPQQTTPTRRPHQARALANLAEVYQRTDRAQTHWACGTGKTLLGRWLHDDTRADTTLVLVPSLALIAQTLQEWQSGSARLFSAIVVCSDPSTVDSWRVDPAWWTQHGVKVTTDPQVVAGFLRASCDRPRVVFSTYHSAPVVAEAARHTGARFDLLIADEAHRLAGRPDERFRVALEDHTLPARRRLYMTATPVHAVTRTTGVVSMADKALFGPAADRITLADAITAGLLVDYQVLILDGTDTGRLGAGRSASAALVAAARNGLTRVITYHSRVRRARWFAADIDGLRLPDGRTVRATAVAGTDPASARQAAISRLGNPQPDTLTVVANARCLSEGVNVPAVDGVLFADPRASGVDVVQAIGRALRPAPGKQRGLIILPVTVPAGAADDEELFISQFGAVWGVLRALRSLDPRMAAELDQLRSWRPANAAGKHLFDRLLYCDLEGVDLAALAARVADDTGADESWATMADLLADWARKHGHTAVPSTAKVGEPRLGQWVGVQRRAYATGFLTADRAARLNAIPGWAWTRDGAWWASDHAAVKHLAEQQPLDLNDPKVANRPLPHRPAKSGMTVGRWCAQQRRAAHDGDLPEWHTRQCDQIPGWTWDAGVSARELRMVDLLAEWVDAHGDANVPHDALWGRAPLGEFITAIRRRRAVGRLALPLLEDVLLVTPSKNVPGGLEWQAEESRWQLYLSALRRHAARTGGCDMPEKHTETLSGWVCNLADWCNRQRWMYRHGNMAPERARLLETVPGWVWERHRKVRVNVGTGARQHGTRLGYAAGCLCELCTKAAVTIPAELIDASPARGHLRILEARVGLRARPAMQQITGLNKKTIDEVINGERTRIHPEVDAALRELTVEGLLAHIEANPRGNDPMPPGPTMALLDDLIGRGWPKAWIARELGANGRSLQIGRNGGAPVRRETAEAVAALHAAVGGRVPPPRRWREGLPSLAEIVAAEPVGSAA